MNLRSQRVTVQDLGDWRESAVGALGRFLSRWGTALAGAVLLAVLLSHVSLTELARTLRGAHPGYVLAAVLCGLLATAVRVVRYGHFFPPHRRWLQLYGVFSLLRLINYALPFRSGEVVALGLLKKRGLAPTVAETSAIWFVLRCADFTALFLLLAAAVNLSVSTHAADPRLQNAALALASLSLLAVVVLPIVLHWAIRRRVVRQGRGWLARQRQAMEDGLQKLQGHRALLWTMVPALLVWTANIGMTTCALLACGAPISACDAALASVIVLAFNLLPIRPPLALGTGDAAWAGTLVLLGVGTAEAIALALGVRLVQMLVTAMDGCIGVAVPTIDRSGKD